MASFPIKNKIKINKDEIKEKIRKECKAKQLGYSLMWMLSHWKITFEAQPMMMMMIIISVHADQKLCKDRHVWKCSCLEMTSRRRI